MRTAGVGIRKNPHAVALGRLDGKARAEHLTAEEIQKIARLGGLKRAETLDGEDRQLIARSGGLKGGKARAAKLTPARRKEIAQKAAAKRWGKKMGP